MAKDLQTAVKIRKTFMDREHKSVRRMNWDWPEDMVEVGTCEAILYRSDKWQTNGKEIDYKHVAEGPQRLLVSESLADIDDLHGPGVRLKKMPDSFAVLAKSLGIQARLYADGLGKRFQKDYVEMRFPKECMLAAGKLRTGDTFCFIYGRSGVFALILGDKLDVLKDGIVG
jgi:hypothetical protein